MVDTAKAATPGAPPSTTSAPDNIGLRLAPSATRRRPTRRSPRPRMSTRLDFVNNRLIPNAMEPRAANGDYDSGRELHALHDEPESACRAAGAVGVHRARAGAQAARDRARRRRRLRLEDLHLRRGNGGAWAAKKDRPAGQVDRATAPRRSSPTRTAAITSPMPRWRWTETARSRPARADDRQPRRLSVDVRVDRCRPSSTRRCSSGQYAIPGDLRRGDGGLHQHRAGRRLSRRGPARGDYRRRAAGRDGGARD